MTRQHFLFSTLAAAGVAANAAPQNRVFELRTYTCVPGRLPALLKRFRDHTTKLFEKHGMTNIGYWIPAEGETHDTTLIYVLAHPSIDEAKANWAAFRDDPEWIKVRTASESDGKIVDHLVSVYMRPADFSQLT